MWIVINFMILLFNYLIKADVNISYVIRNYQNPYNLDSRLRKCEALNVFGDHCDPFFHFAAYTTTERWKKRSTLRKEAGPFVNSKYIDHILDTYEIQPIFPDAIEIELDIHDSDIDEDQRIALFRRTVPLETKGKHEFRMGVDVKVEAHIEITCTKDYYGQRCEVYCTPLYGLWKCDENTGARICSKPCLHGQCVLTSISAICECTFNWHGEFCQTPIESKTILSPDIKTIHVTKPLQINQSIRNQTRYIHFNNKINKLSMITTTVTVTPTPAATITFQSNSINKIKQMEMRKYNGTVQIVQLKFDNLHNIQNEELNIDQSNHDTLFTLTTRNTQINLNQSNVSIIGNNSETMKQSDSNINHLSGQFSNHETRNYIILAFIIIGLLIWLISVLIIGFVCYRRRHNRKVSVRKSALWTNINYEPNLYQTNLPSPTESLIKQQYDHETLQNNLKLITNNNQLNYSSLKKLLPKNVLRNSSTLPKLPINEHHQRRSVHYIHTSNELSKLHFSTISHIPISNPSISVYTQQTNLSPTNSCQPICDTTYEELTCCINDHLHWKHNNLSIAPKLTTFQ
ncbi:unnamed protein product [Schistosoma margrebowiei]|uniref:EGF-like domain-containing protein n=1 Tax=Schistosoma margrebowiei TaxID=48269 RepID=A0AA84ZTT6_9TREM|nr:unnamed protein product [Schistosoma margrebowiei]